jgi:hypothetical protein
MISINALNVRLLLAAIMVGYPLCGQNQTPANAPSPVSQYLGIWHEDLEEAGDCGTRQRDLTTGVTDHCRNYTSHAALKVEQGTSGLAAAFSLSNESLYNTGPASTLTLMFNIDLSLRESLLTGTIRSGNCKSDGKDGALNPETFTATLEGKGLKVHFLVRCRVGTTEGYTYSERIFTLDKYLNK